MTRFIRFLLAQSRAFYLIFALIGLAGILAYRSLPSSVYPELSFPRLVVIADVGDMDPQRLALTVTRPLEEAAGQIYGVRWIRSKTIRGSTEIYIEFDPGTNMQTALQLLQTKIAETRNTLPGDTALTIERITPAIFPVIMYNIVSPTLTPSDLYQITRFQILPRLTRVPGVARVQIQGGAVPEVAVEADPVKLRQYRLGLNDVVDALGRANQIQVVGKQEEHGRLNLIIGSGAAQTPLDLGNMVVAARAPHLPIFLKDIAAVSYGHADPTQLISVDGQKGISLSIFRQPNSDVVAVSQRVRSELTDLSKGLPPGIQIRPSYDESNLVVDARNNVRDAIGIGILLIFIILYLFLREWRSTLIAACTIPLSAFAAFIVLKMAGQSLNLMSLGGLAVAVGLVIDDAIVMIENIDRQLQKGLAPAKAVAVAATELIGPVTSSTITTVVVFLPLGLLSGVAGQFFISLTLSLSAAVVFSLILAFTFTPLLSAQWLKGTFHAGSLKLIERLNSWYSIQLKKVLARPFWIGVTGILLVIGGVVFYHRLGSDFLPDMDEGSYMIDYVAPAGTSLTETAVLAHKMEMILAKTPEVQSWARHTGSENGIFATEPNRGDLMVVLKPPNQRKRSMFDIIAAQRQEISEKIPQVDTDFHQVLQDMLNDLSGTAAPIEVRIFGEDPVILRQWSNKVESRMQSVSGLVDFLATAKSRTPQLEIQVDPVKAGRIGLAAGDVELQVRQALLGGIATQVRQGDRLLDVRVRLPDHVRSDPAVLLQTPITGTNGVVVPLGSLGTVIPSLSEAEITRENQQRYVTVQANLEGRDLGSAVQAVQQKLANLHLPSGYFLSLGGLYQSQQQAFLQLLMVLGLGVLLVYVVLVMQFRSYAQPVAIFTAIPLALFGVMFALWITGTPLNVSSFMGIILLVGLVVKNGIILLEYTNRLRVEGYSMDDALVEAGRVRLRPILMTTLCTLLGLFPLALGLGAGAELQKPLAIAVIGGLSLSTIFTLVFVPVVFRVLERRVRFQEASEAFESLPNVES